MARLSGHGAKVWTVTFSPDGKVVASGSADRAVKLWDIAEIESKEHSRTP